MARVHGKKNKEMVDEMLSHMEPPVPLLDHERVNSQVARLYANRSVFVTGATGFIGKALIEKLVRSCPDIRRIYVLTREKRGRGIQERVADLIKSRFFDRIRELAGSPDEGNRLLEEKIMAIEGDITHPCLGISDDDIGRLSREVSIVFNSAATVRFVEPIDNAVRNNIYSVGQLVELCNKLERLEAIVHLSTAYSNSHKLDTIYETFYEPPMRGAQILDAVEKLRDIQAQVNAISEHDDDDEASHLKAQSGEQVAGGGQMSTMYGDAPARASATSRATAAAAAKKPAGDLLDDFGRILMRRCNRPNTYTVTKAIAESYLLEKLRERPDRYLGGGDNEPSAKIPVAIVRPSVVCCAWREPLVGLVDNYNGATGPLVSLYTGALVAWPSRRTGQSDCVPVDMLVNMIVVTGYFLVARTNSKDGASAQQQVASSWQAPAPLQLEVAPDLGVYVFTFVTGARNPLIMYRFFDPIEELAFKYPSKLTSRVPSALMIPPGRLHDWYDALQHKLPAYLMDLVKYKLLRKPAPAGNARTMMATYARLKMMSETVSPFTCNTYKFSDSNTLALFRSLSETDKSVFHFDVASLDWPKYMASYVIGARMYTLRDEPHTLPAAKAKLKKLRTVSQITMLLFVCLILFTCWLLFFAR